MKKINLLFLALLFLGAINAQTLSYRVGAQGVGGSSVTAEINGYLSTAQQQNVSFITEGNIYNFSNVWTNSGDYDYYVNNVKIGSSTLLSNTVDISAYIPVTSVKVVSKASTWSVVFATVIINPVVALTSGPGVSNITYCKNATAVPLQASLSGTGTSLKWYTSITGEGYSVTAPTPSTATVGTTNYYVSQRDNAGIESSRSMIAVTVEDAIALTCTDDKTVVNPTSQGEVETEFTSFLNGFSNNSANMTVGTFSSETVGFTGVYAPVSWTNAAQSPSSYANHSASALNIGANQGGGGTTRQITVPSNSMISFDWTADFTGSGGYAFEYIVDGVTTSITTGDGTGSKTNIAIGAGKVFQIRTWGYTQYSTYTTTITNFKVSSALSSANVSEVGFVNTIAPANWSNAAQSPSSYANHSASALNIGANQGGGGTTRQITLPYNGEISFDWTANFTGSGGYAFEYIVDGVTSLITIGNGSGSKANIAVSAGKVFQIRTWGLTQYSTYTTTITNFTYTYSKANVGAVAGFFAADGSIAVTYTVAGGCGGTTSCTKTFSTNTSVPTNNTQLEGNELVSYYPNPTKGIVNLTLDQEASLSVYSLEGKIVINQLLTSGVNSVNLEELKSGIYSFRVITNDSVNTFKVVKQ